VAQRIAGTAWFKSDGAILPLKGNFTVSPSPVERAGIAGQDYVHGFSELPRVPYIEGDVSTTVDLSTEAIVAMVNVTITAELANTHTYVLKEAWFAGPQDINTREGQMRIRFEGTSCDELT